MSNSTTSGDKSSSIAHSLLSAFREDLEKNTKHWWVRLQELESNMPGMEAENFKDVGQRAGVFGGWIEDAKEALVSVLITQNLDTIDS